MNIYAEAQAAEDDAGTVEVSFLSDGERRLKVIIVEKKTGKRMVARLEKEVLPTIAEVIRLVGKGKLPSRRIPRKLKLLAGW